MNIYKSKTASFLIVSLFSFSMMEAKVKLPALVSDGMILQRNMPLKIWGSADAGEKVNVKFLNKTYTPLADKSGNWNIMLPELKAGGPYVMTINEITLKDILIGDDANVTVQGIGRREIERARSSRGHCHSKFFCH